jgi:Spy/CpxP family protein refolding chaperone
MAVFSNFNSVLKVLPGLVAAAGLAAIAPPSLAQTVDTAPASVRSAVTLAQATDVDDQPASPDDLAGENLTDEQVAQLEAIFDTYQPQIEAATARYLTSLETINALLVPSTDDLTLTNAHNDVVVAEQAMDELIFQRNLALRSVLSLDQRQVINDYVRAYLGLAAPPQVAVTFPDTLVGLDADTAIANLQADDWGLAFTSPSQVGLNRGSEKLDLFINRSGQISSAQLF